MKQFYSAIFFVAFFAFASGSAAQCTSCTITISSNNSANHIVTSGTTLCITSTGTASGLITVASGGTLCNQGTINSSNLWVAGGTLNNHGTINTSNILTSSGGTFNNYGTATVDSLLITEPNSKLLNYNTINDNRFGVTDGAIATNNGNITANYMGDSIGVVINNGTIVINMDFGNGYNSSFTNNGNFTVNNDFSNGYSATFLNDGYFKVARDFYNGNLGTFTALCMGIVQRDWYNSATIAGPATTSCGGFNVTGQTLNSGTIGTSSQHVDICDAGTAGAIDANIGTIASTTTYCACSNSCINTVGIGEIAESDIMIGNLYPNPAEKNIFLHIKGNRSENISIEVYDMVGKRKIAVAESIGNSDNIINVDISALAQGAYILSVTDSKGLKSRKLFNVTR
ncbi:MAG TPA: T9SS type A sorting domain-containing protein [Bacteroidia bacterium]|jgi:hypothetical protein